MEVAVVPDLQRRGFRRQHAADVIGDLPVLLDQPVRQRGACIVHLVVLGGEEIEGERAAFEQPLGPRGDVGIVDRLGREIGNVGPAGQRGLQFAGAQPDLPHALQVGRKLGVVLGRLRGLRALVVDEAVEIARR